MRNIGEELNVIMKNNQYALPKEVVQILEQCATSKWIAKNEIINDLDAEQIQVYYICSGLIRSYFIDYQGNDITHFFLKEDDYCCSELIIQGKPDFLCFETLEDCRLLCISKRDLQRLLNKSDYCSALYIRILETMVINAIERERGLLTKTATERYLNFINENKGLEERIQKTHLASYLGVTPASLSRIRKTMKMKTEEA